MASDALAGAKTNLKLTFKSDHQSGADQDEHQTGEFYFGTSAESSAGIDNLDHPNWVLLVDIILKTMRQQRRLHPIFAVDEPMHRPAPEAPTFRILKLIHPERNLRQQQIECRFHTASGTFGRVLLG